MTFKGEKINMKKYFPADVWRCYAAGMLFALFSSLTELARPEIIARVIDSAAAGTLDAALLTCGALGVAGVTLLSQIFRYAYQMNTVRGGENFIRHIRDMLFCHILKLPAAWHSTHQTGDMIQRCTRDTEEIKSFLSEQLVNLLTMIITVLLALFFIIRKSLLLAGFAALSIPVMVLYSYRFHESISRAFLECDEAESRLSVIAQDNLTGVQVVRAFCGERTEKARFEAVNNEATEKWIELDKHLVRFWVAADIITGAVMMGYLLLGSAECVYGRLTVGGFVASVSFLIILIQPVRNMGRVLSEMSKANVSLGRIDEIMSEPEEKDGENALEGEAAPMDGDIVFDNVSFAYPDGNGRRVLKNISFRIRAGKTLGILGNTGSGKSTIAELLTGMYYADSGRISIGNNDIRAIRRSWLRRNIGIADQNAMLFGRSIRENLMLAVENAGEEELQAAVETACLDKTVREFPDGLDTIVGERGVTLSGGQRQRAVIARTLLLNTPVLVFDDSLSAVDAATDAQIRAGLEKSRHGRTAVIISHRINTVMNADNIIVMQDGRIAEEGTHAELLRIGGLYSRIFRLQHGTADSSDDANTGLEGREHLTETMGKEDGK